MKLTVLSPVYNASGTLENLVERILKSKLDCLDYLEIILVDDMSQDDSWRIIENMCSRNENIFGIKLSRNFGQHYAITAGLEHATGDWVVIMDCDLQDQPEEIPKLFKKAQEGYQVVLASRKDRKDNFIKRMYSFLFYKVLSWLTGEKQDESVGNFGIYSRAVINKIIGMPEKVRYLPSMVKWVGFPSVTVPVDHQNRALGKSNYNFRKSMKLALDIILSYSDKPIKIIMKLGILIALISFLFILRIVVLWLGGNIEVMGYTSLIVSIWFLSGCIMATLGVLGLYIGKIFDNVKNRPLYIIEKYAGNQKA